ncbi:hypothetical protein H4Q26_003685 [Puccinia striiformis f. sp. tritici PST-130]|nr:hypothetical protein H4Q26_003685 [Puccinia striiformis f. sp. tritici PST-130]
MPMHPVSNICGSQDDSCLVPSMQMISLLLLISLCSTSVACGAIIDRAVKTLTEAGDVDGIPPFHVDRSSGTSSTRQRNVRRLTGLNHSFCPLILR